MNIMLDRKSKQRVYNNYSSCSLILLDSNKDIILGTRTDFSDEKYNRMIEEGKEFKWTNAGGGIEFSERPIYGMLRELEEEFGIKGGLHTTTIKPIDIIEKYYLHKKSMDVRCRKHYIFITSLRQEYTVENLIPHKKEIGEIKSFSKEEIIQMTANRQLCDITEKTLLREIKRRVYF